MSPPHAHFFKASYWPRDYMISLSPHQSTLLPLLPLLPLYPHPSTAYFSHNKTSPPKPVTKWAPKWTKPIFQPPLPSPSLQPPPPQHHHHQHHYHGYEIVMYKTFWSHSIQYSVQCIILPKMATLQMHGEAKKFSEIF